MVAQNTLTKFDDTNILFIDLPASTEKDNTKLVEATAVVNLKNATLQLDAQLSLSGQYSTLLRNYYQHNELSNLCNPYYFQKFYEWRKDTKIIENKPIEIVKEYPFTAKKSMKFEVIDAVKNQADTIFTINLNNCLQQVYDVSMAQAEGRNYYFDFKKQDRFIYTFTFEQAVELMREATEDFVFTQATDFGKYYLKIEQQSPTKITIESNFVVHKDVAEESELSALRAIYRNIKLSNELLFLKVKVVE